MSDLAEAFTDNELSVVSDKYLDRIRIEDLYSLNRDVSLSNLIKDLCDIYNSRSVIYSDYRLPRLILQNTNITFHSDTISHDEYDDYDIVLVFDTSLGGNTFAFGKNPIISESLDPGLNNGFSSQSNYYIPYYTIYWGDGFKSYVVLYYGDSIPDSESTCTSYFNIQLDKNPCTEIIYNGLNAAIGHTYDHGGEYTIRIRIRETGEDDYGLTSLVGMIKFCLNSPDSGVNLSGITKLLHFAKNLSVDNDAFLNLPNLRYVNLSGAKMANSNILKGSPVEYLDLSYAFNYDAINLIEFTDLKTLKLHHTSVKNISNIGYTNITTIDQETLPTTLTTLAIYSANAPSNKNKISYIDKYTIENTLITSIGRTAGLILLNCTNPDTKLSINSLALANIQTLQTSCLCGITHIDYLNMHDSLSLREILKSAIVSTDIKEISLPGALIKFNADAIIGNNDLSSINFNDSQYANLNMRLTAVSHMVHLSPSLKLVVLPNNLVISPSAMFYKCSSLTSMYIPDSTISIECGTFMNSAKNSAPPDSLHNIRIPFIGLRMYPSETATTAWTNFDFGSVFRPLSNATGTQTLLSAWKDISSLTCVNVSLVSSEASTHSHMTKLSTYYPKTLSSVSIGQISSIIPFCFIRATTLKRIIFEETDYIRAFHPELVYDHDKNKLSHPSFYACLTAENLYPLGGLSVFFESRLGTAPSDLLSVLYLLGDTIFGLISSRIYVLDDPVYNNTHDAVYYFLNEFQEYDSTTTPEIS